MMYSCIDFSLRKPPSLEVKATCSLREDPVNAHIIGAFPTLEVKATCSLREDPVNAHRIGAFPKFSFNMVCKTSSKFYLKVEPELIWLTKDNDFSQDVKVRSNVEWTIE